jgi:hypothetical protein
MSPEVTLFEVATTARELWRLVNMSPTGRASYVALVTASVPDRGTLAGTPPAYGASRGGVGAGVSRKTRPVMCRGDGASSGTPAAPAFRTRAGATTVKSGAPALDDEQAPTRRLVAPAWLPHPFKSSGAS